MKSPPTTAKACIYRRQPGRTSAPLWLFLLLVSTSWSPACQDSGLVDLYDRIPASCRAVISFTNPKNTVRHFLSFMENAARQDYHVQQQWNTGRERLKKALGLDLTDPGDCEKLRLDLGRHLFVALLKVGKSLEETSFVASAAVSDPQAAHEAVRRRLVSRRFSGRKRFNLRCTTSRRTLSFPSTNRGYTWPWDGMC